MELLYRHQNSADGPISGSTLAKRPRKTTVGSVSTDSSKRASKGEPRKRARRAEAEEPASIEDDSASDDEDAISDDGDKEKR